MVCDSNSRGQNLKTQEINCVLNILLTLCSRFMWQVVGRGEVTVRRGQGLPCAGHSQTQDTLQSTAESLSQAGDTSGRTCLRKGTPEWQESEGRTSPWKSSYPLKPMQMPQWSTRIFLKELKPMENPHQSRGKTWWGRRQSTGYNPPAILHVSLHGRRRVCEKPSWAWGKGEERNAVLSLFLTTWIDFRWQ